MNKYVDFIDDEALIMAISKLYQVYQQSSQGKRFADLNRNTMDPIKFQFDTIFLYDGDGRQTLTNEIFRQADKTITNAMGAFHQTLIGSIYGFEETPEMPCDCKKSDNTIFVEVKNKHNTMNARSAEAVFQELNSLTRAYPRAMCYCCDIISDRSHNSVWSITVNGTRAQNERIHKISADRFYAIATGDDRAFFKLCASLRKATYDFLERTHASSGLALDTDYPVFDELGTENITDTLFVKSLGHYNGF